MKEVTQDSRALKSELDNKKLKASKFSTLQISDKIDSKEVASMSGFAKTPIAGALPSKLREANSTLELSKPLKISIKKGITYTQTKSL